MAQNPYLGGTKPSLTKSVVAFLDILGFKERVIAADKADQGNDLLQALFLALGEARQHVDPVQRIGDLELPPIHASKFFTDNVVLGIPIQQLDDEGEGSLGHALDIISRYQLTMALHGFYVRGAVDFASHYMDDDLVYGVGLIKTYQLEGTQAIFPRVILSDLATLMTVRHMRWYGEPNWAPHDELILVDGRDNKFFVNYLRAAVDEDTGAVDTSILSQHRDRVVAELVRFKSKPKIYRKYAWLAQYHNWFCAQYALRTERVSIRSQILKPTRISQHFPSRKKLMEALKGSPNL